MDVRVCEVAALGHEAGIGGRLVVGPEGGGHIRAIAEQRRELKERNVLDYNVGINEDEHVAGGYVGGLVAGDCRTPGTVDFQSG